MVDDVTGEVFLRQTLLDDNDDRYEVRTETNHIKKREIISLFLFQFRVQAVDAGTGALRAEQPAVVVVLVSRNRRTPQFTNLPASIEANQSAVTGDVIFTVTSRDEDDVSPFRNVTCVKNFKFKATSIFTK